MFITQCFFSEMGEDKFWHDLNSWHDLNGARKDLAECKKMYKKSQGYKWRIIDRTEFYRKTEKVVR